MARGELSSQQISAVFGAFDATNFALRHATDIPPNRAQHDQVRGSRIEHCERLVQALEPGWAPFAASSAASPKCLDTASASRLPKPRSAASTAKSTSSVRRMDEAGVGKA